MSKAVQAAAIERLRYLRDVFANISSPGQLTDSMTELGCIYYELAKAGLLPCDDVVRDLGINAVQHSRPHTSDVADHSYLSLAAYIVRYSTRQRLLLHPAAAAEVPQWQITRSTQAADQAEPVVTTEPVPSSGSMMWTDFQNDYVDQGKRFALFISELLAQLQTLEPGNPDAASDPIQSSTSEQKTKTRKRTDPSTHVNKLRQRIAAEGYVYPGNYSQLVKQIGGSMGTWTNIFDDPENADLLEWRDNKGVYARNCQDAAEQIACEPEEYLPDEEVRTLFAEQVKQLPSKKRELAWEQFDKMEPDEQRRFILGTRS